MKRIKYKVESFFKESFKIILTVIILTSTIFFLLLNFDEKSKEEKIKILIENEKIILKSEIELLEENIEEIKNDLNFLAFTCTYFCNNKEGEEKLAKLWSEFSKNTSWYDQIRLIGLDGMELIRINLVDNEGIIVSEELLQNKSHRDYFKEGMSLGRDETYISQFNLNIENKMVETPFKPVIRFSQKVFDTEGNNIGLLVLNYLGGKIIKDFEKIANESQGHIYLLNKDGYWLYGGDRDDEWSFLFNGSKGKNFADDFEKEWDKVLEGQDEIITSNGFFLADYYMLGKEKLRVIFHIGEGDKNSYLFNETKKSKYKRIISDNLLVFIILIAVLVLAESILSFYFGYKRVRVRADIDALTGVLTRRAGIEKLKKVFRKKENYSKDLSVIFVDINNLKKVNDTYGHKLGDEFIQSTVKVMKEVVRDEDFIFRYGGDEFIIVLLGVNKELAEKVWTRIEEEFQNKNSNGEDIYTLSASHGVIYVKIDENIKVLDIIRYADKRMYIDKHKNKKSRS